jgi:hypothetical protein
MNMKFKAILYSVYARLLWALIGYIIGWLAVDKMGRADRSFKRFMNDQWKE